MTGWKLTPRETKTEMHVAGTKLFELRRGAWPGTYPLWKAMHDAAPSPPEDVLERMAGAFLGFYSTSFGTRSDQIAAMRAALSAAEEQGDG